MAVHKAEGPEEIKGRGFFQVVTFSSALRMAIKDPSRIACVKYLLDEAGMSLPSRTDSVNSLNATRISLVHMARAADHAIPVFMLLVALGFDLLALYQPDSSGLNSVDFLLGVAGMSTNKNLLRYLLKDLGLSGMYSNVKRSADILYGEWKEQTGDAASSPFSQPEMLLTSSQLNRLEKVKIMSSFTYLLCEKVSRVNDCGRCRKAWYCSVGCQRSHWKTTNKCECQSLQHDGG